MGGTVQQPADIPKTRTFEGKQYTWKGLWDTNKRVVQSEGETLKRYGGISNYRTVAFDDVLIRVGPDGNFERHRIYALYVRD